MASKELGEPSNLCNFCQSNEKKYSCPRCNADYCSLLCYQSSKHLQCSENFYQKCIMDEIALTSHDEESQRKTLEALGRVQNEIGCGGSDEYGSELDSDDENSDEEVDLSERLAGVDLDDTPKVWEKLTKAERRQFKAFLGSSDISLYVAKWDSWWDQQMSDAKIQDLDKIDDYKKNCPEIIKNIPEFHTLTKTPPAACVKHNITNVIGAYAFTLRYFNGTHTQLAEEAVDCIITLSLCLKTNENYEDYDAAVDSVHRQCNHTEWMITDIENINYMMQDTNAILKGPLGSDKNFYILCALSELYNLIQATIKVVSVKTPKNGIQGFRTSNIRSSNLKLVEKKIEYFLSYTASCYDH